MYASSRTWDRHAGGSLVSTHRHLPLLIFGGKRMLLLGILSQTNQEMVSQVQGTLSHQSARSRSETYTKKKTVFEPHPWKRGPIPGPGGRSGRTASFTWACASRASEVGGELAASLPARPQPSLPWWSAAGTEATLLWVPIRPVSAINCFVMVIAMSRYKVFSFLIGSYW